MTFIQDNLVQKLTGNGGLSHTYDLGGGPAISSGIQTVPVVNAMEVVLPR